jgi:hypothetical protein
MGQVRAVPESRVGDDGGEEGYEIITLELELWFQILKIPQNKQKLVAAFEKLSGDPYHPPMDDGPPPPNESRVLNPFSST